MCSHRGPDDREDCILSTDASTGLLVCVQHPPPIPRQRDDDADVRVAEMQREAAS